MIWPLLVDFNAVWFQRQSTHSICLNFSASICVRCVEQWTREEQYEPSTHLSEKWAETIWFKLVFVTSVLKTSKDYTFISTCYSEWERTNLKGQMQREKTADAFSFPCSLLSLYLSFFSTHICIGLNRCGLKKSTPFLILIIIIINIISSYRIHTHLYM